MWYFYYCTHYLVYFPVCNRLYIYTYTQCMYIYYASDWQFNRAVLQCDILSDMFLIFWSAFGVIWAHTACNIERWYKHIIPFTLAAIQHFELRLVYYDDFSYHTVTWSKSLQSSETSENQNLYHNQLVTLKSHHTWPWITPENEAVSLYLHRRQRAQV